MFLFKSLLLAFSRLYFILFFSVMNNIRALLLLIPIIICVGSCEGHEKHKDKYNLTIVNNSDTVIAFMKAFNLSFTSDTICIKPGNTRMEHKKFIDYNSIAPHSSKILGVDSSIDYWKRSPHFSRFSIGIFYLDDVLTLSCEDFIRCYPLKREWVLSVEDLEAGRTLTYP